ncbi:YceH family protein [bacterium]|nr:YceH family protein [bacterium]
MNDEPIRPVPLTSAARRVLGVLVEKAKTTPDNYPLTLNSIVTASNQKSNRDPKMELDDDQVLTALDELRQKGAVTEVQGSGRVIKYRHAAYQWLDVDGPGSAIMTELLLRGPQTLGELRTRASRMHAFVDLSAVQNEIKQLRGKGLVKELTPAGRGQLLAHTLYPPQEQQYLQAKLEKRAATEVKDLPHANAESESSRGEFSSSENLNAVDKLLSRLEAVTERIDALEKRLAELEE